MAVDVSRGRKGQTAEAPVEPSTVEAPSGTATPEAAAMPKKRVAHYRQIVIRLHEDSKVNLDDLAEVLNDRAAAEGEAMTTFVEGEQKRYKGTVYQVGPKSATRRSAQERLAEKLTKLREQAAKAGVDLNTL